jgi:hypothetical protein
LVVRGLYAYAAQGDDEISVTVGSKIELTSVGEQYGDGWSEGIDAQGKKVRTRDAVLSSPNCNQVFRLVYRGFFLVTM